VRGVPPASASDARKAWLRDRWESRQMSEATRARETLNKWYGPEKGKAVRFAETFEICEYGRKPTDAELKTLFPFFEK
jgi:hypothetical protein